jgi:hypothetical protein
MVWAHIKKALDFGYFFVLEIPNFDQKFRWAKVLSYRGSILCEMGKILGKFWAIFGQNFTKRLVILLSVSLKLLFVTQFLDFRFSLKLSETKFL